MYRTHYSNRVELLFGELKETLFKETFPLTRRLVIVPSRAMKSWLSLQLAKELGIAAGLEILAAPSLRQIMLATTPHESQFLKEEPTEIELTLALEQSIRTLCQKAEEEKWLPLIDYIGKTRHLTQREMSRILSLASNLACAFIEYGIYGKELISSWDEGRHHLGWQELLWQRMEEIFFPWNYPAKVLPQIEIRDDLLPEMLQIHLFGLSYFPPIYLQFLHRISKNIPVYFYQLSPCQKFWGDLLTVKESSKLLNFWKKNDLSLSKQEALEDFIQDHNPLLANLGKLGREMTNVMEEFSEERRELYSLPKSICNYPEYNELLTDEVLLEATGLPLTLLEAIQADMALLRNPETHEPINFELYDFSVQIHAAPKKRREVEAVRDALLQIFDQSSKADPIYPGDVLVMAPDIDSYLPFIRLVFEKSDPAIEIQVVKPHSLMDYEITQGFMHLLDVAKGRFEASQFLKLLSFSSFRKKHNIESKNLSIIESWVKDAKIFWGMDANHRSDVLSREYPFKQTNLESPQGTWEDGFGRLLDGLIFHSENHEASVNSNPLNHIEFSQGPLLSSLLALLDSFKKDLKQLVDLEGSLNVWTDFLRYLLEAYFSPYDDNDSNDAYQMLVDTILKLKTSSNALNEATFTFETIYHVLKTSLGKRSTIYKENNLNALKISSLLPMRTVPAKVVVLMGLGDGLFPHQDLNEPWNLILDHPLADYCPKGVDFDRYVFLEAILSARKYLIFSYTSAEPGNMNELEPSLLVKEVIQYLDDSYRIGERKPSAVCLQKHPLDSFDEEYFSGGKGISYSLANYKAACAYYNEVKKKPYSFIECFAFPSSKGETMRRIELSSLLAFAKNPLKVFLNSKGIYINRDDASQIQNDAELFFTELNSWILLRESATSSIDEALLNGEKKGMFSHGSFREAGKEKFKAEFLSFQGHIEELVGKNQKISSIIFTDKQIGEQSLNVPPIRLHSHQYGQIEIVGKIDLVITEGLLLLVKDELKRAVEFWPMILAYACLLKMHQLPFKANAIFLKGFQCKVKPIEFQDCESLLIRFIEYYLSMQNSPSPLSPENATRFLKGEKPFSQTECYDNYDSWAFRDPHTRWLDMNSAHADIHAHFDDWKSTVCHLYASMPARWYQRSLKNQEAGHEDV